MKINVVSWLLVVAIMNLIVSLISLHSDSQQQQDVGTIYTGGRRIDSTLLTRLSGISDSLITTNDSLYELLSKTQSNTTAYSPIDTSSNIQELYEFFANYTKR